MEKHDIGIEDEVGAEAFHQLIVRGINAALEDSDVTKADMSVLLVGDERMQELNREYLEHDYTTDVLSFDLGDTPECDLLGQLIICIPYAEREAGERALGVEEELVRYAIHGTLHLLGYDDHDEPDREEMWRVQEELVRNVMGAT